MPLGAAALEWLDTRFQPTIERLAPLAGPRTDVPERYCQVLEHKWFLSERAGRDVGLGVALADYLARAERDRGTMMELPPTE